MTIDSQKAGVPIRTRVNFEGGGKWNIQLMTPPLDFNILQGRLPFIKNMVSTPVSLKYGSAAGVDEKTHDVSEKVGKITLRHVYEIARFQARDDWYISRLVSIKNSKFPKSLSNSHW